MNRNFHLLSSCHERRRRLRGCRNPFHKKEKKKKKEARKFINERESDNTERSLSPRVVPLSTGEDVPAEHVPNARPVRAWGCERLRGTFPTVSREPRVDAVPCNANVHVRRFVRGPVTSSPRRATAVRRLLTGKRPGHARAHGRYPSQKPAQ